jgi:hypothetical protein
VIAVSTIISLGHTMGCMFGVSNSSEEPQTLQSKASSPKHTKPYALENLYRHYFENTHPSAHRAMGDVVALDACLYKLYPAAVDKVAVVEEVIKTLFVIYTRGFSYD